MPNENLWWTDPLLKGLGRGYNIVSGWGRRGKEAAFGLGETEEERQARLERYIIERSQRDWAKQDAASPYDKGEEIRGVGLAKGYTQIDYPGVLEAKGRYIGAQDPGLEYQPGVGVVSRVTKKEKDEESEFDKYMKMQFLSKLIERPKAPSPGYATRAGTTRQPVATSLMQTYPQRRQDDLLNFRYGRSYGRMV